MPATASSPAEQKQTQCLGSGAGKVVEGASAHDAGKTGKGLTRADLTRNDLTGLQLGSYDLAERIGQGGMGQVFRARHRHLHRDVAIKFVNAASAPNRELDSRFVEEIRAVGQLQHPNIVQASDAGAIDGIQYLVTEILHGTDLVTLLEQKGPMPIGVAMEIIRQAALGLAHAHRLGFVHRDIKPSNLFCTNDGQIKVLDFGLVSRPKENSDLTAFGSFMGTMDYIAPEQAENASLATHQSDLYSLGCTLIFLLTSQPPFPDSIYPTSVMKLRGHLTVDPSWEDRAAGTVPGRVSLIVKRMMAKNRDERFASCDEVANATLSIADPSELKRWITENATILPIHRHMPNRNSLNATPSNSRLIKGAVLAVASMSLICVILLAASLMAYTSMSKHDQSSSRPDKSQHSGTNSSLSPATNTLPPDVDATIGPSIVLNAPVPSLKIPVGRGLQRTNGSAPSKQTKSQTE